MPLQLQGFPEAVAGDIARLSALLFPELPADLQLKAQPQECQALLSCRASGRSETLTLPLEASQLQGALARLQAGAACMPAVMLGGFVRFDTQRRQLLAQGQPEQLLTDKEADLLTALLEAAPAHVSRAALLEQVWQYDEQIDTRTLETHIYRLRQKLEPFALAGLLETSDDGYVWRGDTG